MGKIYSTKNDSNIYKKARQAIGLTQAEVSQYLHINRSAISKWESGSSIPDPALLPKIAKLYNVTTDYLLGLDNSVFDKNINTNNTILRLKELRLSRGIKTQKEMAKLLGVAYNTYNYWENEQFQLDYKNLIRIADYFNVSIDYLLGRSESSAVSAPQAVSQVNYDDETTAILELLEKLPYGGKVLVCRFAELTYKDITQIQEKRDNSTKKLS